MKKFVTDFVNLMKDNLILTGIIVGFLVVIFLVICVMIAKKSKARKAAKAQALSATPKQEPLVIKKEPLAAEEAPAQKEPEPVIPVVKTTPAPAPTPIAEASAVAPAKAEEKPAPVKKPTVKKAPVEETAPAERGVEEKKAPAKKPAAKKAPAQKQTKAKEVEDAFAMVENVDESVPEMLRDHYEEDETDKLARYKGKWVICRVLTDEEESEEMYFFELRASNGEKLLSSEEYTSYQGAIRGIQTHKTNILKENFKITLSKKGDYIFKLLSGKNMLLCMGENYPTRARCESAIESAVRFAETAILDENVQDIVIKVPKEEDTPPPPLPDGYNGKWIISSKLAGEDEIYYFELFANNGEKLLSSEEYTTYIGAVNGIQTHKKNIEKDNFRISLTKRGDYIYKLLNGNGQLLCLGEHYKTKRLCQNAVESVKRFAIGSPVLTEEKKK